MIYSMGIPVTPEYTRLLAMLDYDPAVYRRWLKTNIVRLMEMMHWDDIDTECNNESTPWLLAQFIHEHWSTT